MIGVADRWGHALVDDRGRNPEPTPGLYQRLVTERNTRWIKAIRARLDDEGFQTVSIPYAELYTALQTGVADGWSGGPAMVNYIEFRDVIKYFIASNNYFENTSYLMGMKSWDKLTPEQQKIVQEAALEISAKSFDISEAAESGYLDKMEEAGIKVVRFSPEQLKAYAELCRKVSWPKMEERLGKEVIDDLLAEYK